MNEKIKLFEKHLKKNITYICNPTKSSDGWASVNIFLPSHVFGQATKRSNKKKNFTHNSFKHLKDLFCKLALLLSAYFLFDPPKWKMV